MPEYIRFGVTMCRVCWEKKTEVNRRTSALKRQVYIFCLFPHSLSNWLRHDEANQRGKKSQKSVNVYNVDDKTWRISVHNKSGQTKFCCDWCLKLFQTAVRLKEWRTNTPKGIDEQLRNTPFHLKLWFLPVFLAFIVINVRQEYYVITIGNINSNVSSSLETVTNTYDSEKRKSYLKKYGFTIFILLKTFQWKKSKDERIITYFKV